MAQPRMKDLNVTGEGVNGGWFGSVTSPAHTGALAYNPDITDPSATRPDALTAEALLVDLHSEFDETWTAVRTIDGRVVMDGYGQFGGIKSRHFLEFAIAPAEVPDLSAYIAPVQPEGELVSPTLGHVMQSLEAANAMGSWFDYVLAPDESHILALRFTEAGDGYEDAWRIDMKSHPAPSTPSEAISTVAGALPRGSGEISITRTPTGGFAWEQVVESSVGYRSPRTFASQAEAEADAHSFAQSDAWKDAPGQSVPALPAVGKDYPMPQDASCFYRIHQGPAGFQWAWYEDGRFVVAGAPTATRAEALLGAASDADDTITDTSVGGRLANSLNCAARKVKN